MCHTDAGRTAGTRPLQCRGVALGDRTAKAPARGLSTLHSMASGLAVYASPDRLPGLDAKLASSRWSDATGRALHPQGPNRRFQSACIISSSFSKLAWRNRLNRSAQATANERTWRCIDRGLLLQPISPPLTCSSQGGENAVSDRRNSSDRRNRGCPEEDQPGNRGEQRVGRPPSFWAGDPDRTLVSRNCALCPCAVPCPQLCVGRLRQ